MKKTVSKDVSNVVPIAGMPLIDATPNNDNFSYFFKRNDDYIHAALADDLKLARKKEKEAMLETERIKTQVNVGDGYTGRPIYPSPTGRSAFSLSMDYGAESHRTDPNDVPMDLDFDADEIAEREMDERAREQQNPNHPHLGR